MKNVSYLVLSLGAVLSLCGALAIYAGYGIIMVERGWAGVIAGATLLSGGIVTIALGFILHSLSGLHVLPKTRHGLTPRPREIGEGGASELRPEPGLAINPEASVVAGAGPPQAAVPPAASARTWPQRPTRPSLPPARNVMKARGVPAARGTPASDFALPKLPLVARPAPSISQPATEPWSEAGFAMQGEVAAAKSEDDANTPAVSAPAVEAPAEPAWNGDGEPGLFDDGQARELSIEARLEEPHIGLGEPETEAGPGVNLPAEPATFDAMFGVIEPRPALDTRKEGANPSPEAIELAGGDPAPPIVSEALPAADPHRPLPQAVPAAGKAGLAIVGRYESEGTSYVMYADGSVEARSEHGVFHFRSMAELKAFMESQA